MAWLLFNKFKGDRVRGLLVQELREMLQALGGNNVSSQARIVKCYNYEEQLAFLTDPGVADVQVTQTTIPQNAAFQTDDLDTYDPDCDDISSTKTVLMANLSS
ncbi:hypothetical protein Tco_0126248 [Tanacetum coccineum]